MFGSSLPSLWSSATKVYSGQGADIVMQSLEIRMDAYDIYHQELTLSRQAQETRIGMPLHSRA
jgi:hypothetical protein